MVRRMKFTILIILLALCNVGRAQPLIEANQAFQNGKFKQAIIHWQKVLTTTKNTEHQLEAWLGITRVYQWLGDYNRALNIINTALPIAKQNVIYHALFLTELSKVRLSQESKWDEQAKQQAKQALKIARKANNPALLAEVLKQWGNVLTIDYNYEEAIAVYKEAITKAGKFHRAYIVGH